MTGRRRLARPGRITPNATDDDDQARVKYLQSYPRRQGRRLAAVTEDAGIDRSKRPLQLRLQQHCARSGLHGRITPNAAAAAAATVVYCDECPRLLSPLPIVFFRWLVCRPCSDVSAVHRPLPPRRVSLHATLLNAVNGCRTLRVGKRCF